MNYSVPWGETENRLYDRLIDDPHGDPYHIVDLLEHEQLLDVPVDDADLEHTVDITDKCLDYINEELRGNEHVFAQDLIRPGRYPRIRQMRDVHEFDVGSHLALCHAYAVRQAPVHMVGRLGLDGVGGLLRDANAQLGSPTLGLAAVFHDFFKCFRQRRRLPSKTGTTASLTWRLPSGEQAAEELSVDENDIAAEVLPYLVGDGPEIKAVTGSIQLSGKFGSLLYKLLDRSDAEAQALADAFWSEQMSPPGLAAGLYIGITDWMGKGWAQELVTYRKSRVRSLRNAGRLALARLEPLLNTSSDR
jgi:hypothetical protein